MGSSVLQEIIQETTNRINRLQQQKSENDVSREKMVGELEIEKERTALIQAKSEIFLCQLSEAIPESKERLDLLKFFGEQSTSTQQTEHLASGRANLFLTP